MKLRTQEIAGAAAFLLFILFCFYLTSLIDLSFSSSLESFTGPRAYPRIILGVMLVLAALLLVQAFTISGDDAEKADPLHPRLTRVAAAIVLTAIFTALFKPLGYILTVPVLIFLVAILNGASSIWRTALTAIAAAAICLVIFRYGLNTVLPEGILGIDQIL